MKINKKKDIKKIEKETAMSEVFLEAVDFFTEAGVNFINSRREHRYGLSILIDDELKKPIVVSTFTFAMSRNALAGLYVTLLKGERFGGKRRIQSLIKVFNDLIRAGYARGSLTSHNIETGKYRLKSTEVISIFSDITSKAMEYSMGGDNLQHIGDIYALLGGYYGTYQFFKEVLLATESSIPSLEEEDMSFTRYIPDIKCYTCKYCKCDKNGVRTCTKVSTSITGVEYDSHPGRYVDAHHTESEDGVALVSAIIDERMDTCDDYVCRIK